MGAPHLIRLICASDDAAVAALVRSVLPEFIASEPCGVVPDAELAAMSQAYSAPRAAYFVVEQEGVLVGGAGVAPLAGAPFEVCELRKMYFLPGMRGQGVGTVLLRRCLRTARGFGYQTCYLQTLSSMDAARHMYEKAGFRPLRAPLAASGQSGCDRWFALEL
jgi:putative acetyltransferase